MFISCGSEFFVFFQPKIDYFEEMSDLSSGLNNVSNPTTYFHSLSSNSQMNGLATDLSDLAIGDRPPPRKIRRRNALTVQDPHFPPHIVPPPNSPVHDAFEDSSRLQALDEIVHRDFKLDDTPSPYYSCPLPNPEPKRKLAANRRRGPTLPGEDKEVQKILLHKDLEDIKPSACLPEILVRKYAKSVRSNFNNPCCALVPYQSPNKLISEILNNSEKKNSDDKRADEDEDSSTNMDMDE